MNIMGYKRPNNLFTIDRLDAGEEPNRPLSLADIDFLWADARYHLEVVQQEEPSAFNEGYYRGMEMILELIRVHSEWARNDRINKELQQAREREN